MIVSTATSPAEGTIATTEAHGGPAGEHGPELLGLGAEGWVYVGVTLFLLFAVFWLKAPKIIADALDKRIAETRRELDEARALRSEAEALLAEAKKRHEASAGDADAIVAHAEEEAKELLAQAETDASDLVARRQHMAEDKIAAAERQAIADVRARAADAAARAAHRIIADKHDAAADKPMVDHTIENLNRLN